MNVVESRPLFRPDLLGKVALHTIVIGGGHAMHSLSVRFGQAKELGQSVCEALGPKHC